MAESDQVWHFAQDDKEHGPITAAQLKGLATSGKLKPDDLVWKEGMENWVVAQQVPGLFGRQAATSATTDSSAETTVEAEPEPPAVSPEGGLPVPPAPVVEEAPAAKIKTSNPRKKRFASRAKNELTDLSIQLGRIGLGLGFVFILLSSGCENIGNQKKARFEAKKKLVEDRLDDRYFESYQKLRDRRDDIRDDTDLDNAERREKLAAVAEQEDDLDKEKEEELKKLRRGKLRDLEIAAREANLRNNAMGYWRAMLSLFGFLLLTGGVIVVGFVGKGFDRWICFAILMVIVLNIFGGGAVQFEVNL